MEDQPVPGGKPRSQLDVLERATLGQLLEHHPAFYTLAELARELDEPEDVVEETVAALARAGLVNRWGGFVVPSRAALRFDDLDW
jgi:DNA-binding IclR family transcriptional regulator